MGARFGFIALLLSLTMAGPVVAQSTEEPEPPVDEAQPAPSEADTSSTEPAADSSAPIEPEVAAEAESAEAVEPAPESTEPVGVIALPDEPAALPVDSGTTQLENVVVTAQKRQQSVQQVPISMSVMTENFIREQGITDLGDALLFVPNFRVVQNSYSITPQCRGFVIEFQNASFEPPCGVAVDGIAYTRAYYFADALFDTERIEVLRGPQGTTFGKNTTAGVVSLTTKDPSDVFNGKIDLQYGPDGRKRVEAGIGGALISDFADFRLAGLFEDRRGYVLNTTFEQDPIVPEYGGGYDRKGVRAKVLMPDLFGTQLKFAFQSSESAYVGATQELVLQEDGKDRDLAAYFRQYDPNADFTAKNWINSVAGKQRGQITTTQASFDWLSQWDGWDVTLAGAAGKLEQDGGLEVVNVPVRVIFADKSESDPFKTIELRTVSPELPGLLGVNDLFGVDLGRTTALLGLYYQEQRLDPVNTDVVLCQDRLAAYLVAAQNQGVIPPPTNCDSTGWAYSRYKQAAETYAAFTQVTWNVTERWMLELGGRYTTEDKQAHWDVSYSPGVNLLDLQNNKAFVADREISEAGFQPKVTIGFAPTTDLNFFAHWAQGFKSGGFNEYALAGNPEDPTRPPDRQGSLSYGPERASDFGIDAKMDLLERRLRFNVSLYRLDVEDFQVLSTVFGTLVPGTNTRLTDGYDQVVNAGKARAQGAEADIVYLVTDWLTAIATVGYNDTEFLDFKQSACPWYAEQEMSPERDPVTGKCDATGKSFAYTPDWNNTLTLQSFLPMGSAWSALDGMDLLFGGTAEYIGEYYLFSTLDDRMKQQPFWRYRAHVGVGNKGQGWDFRITGLNLADTYIESRSSFDGTFYVMTPEQPRTFYGQLSWTF